MKHLQENHAITTNTACLGIVGAPCLVDRMFAVHAGSRGFDSHQRHMSEQFFRSNRQGYQHTLCSELENSGIRMAVGDCSVTDFRDKGREAGSQSHKAQFKVLNQACHQGIKSVSAQ